MLASCEIIKKSVKPPRIATGPDRVDQHSLVVFQRADKERTQILGVLLPWLVCSSLGPKARVLRTEKLILESLSWDHL